MNVRALFPSNRTPEYMAVEGRIQSLDEPACHQQFVANTLAVWKLWQIGEIKTRDCSIGLLWLGNVDQIVKQAGKDFALIDTTEQELVAIASSIDAFLTHFRNILMETDMGNGTPLDTLSHPQHLKFITWLNLLRAHIDMCMEQDYVQKFFA